MYEITEIMEPYGLFVIKTVPTEREAKTYCDEKNKKWSVVSYHTYRKVISGKEK